MLTPEKPLYKKLLSIFDISDHEGVQSIKIEMTPRNYKVDVHYMKHRQVKVGPTEPCPDVTLHYTGNTLEELVNANKSK